MVFWRITYSQFLHSQNRQAYLRNQQNSWDWPHENITRSLAPRQNHKQLAKNYQIKSQNHQLTWQRFLLVGLETHAWRLRKSYFWRSVEWQQLGPHFYRWSRRNWPFFPNFWKRVRIDLWWGIRFDSGLSAEKHDSEPHRADKVLLKVECGAWILPMF